jgi:hypothetical protein
MREHDWASGSTVMAGIGKEPLSHREPPGASKVLRFRPIAVAWGAARTPSRGRFCWCSGVDVAEAVETHKTSRAFIAFI